MTSLSLSSTTSTSTSSVTPPLSDHKCLAEKKIRCYGLIHFGQLSQSKLVPAGCLKVRCSECAQPNEWHTVKVCGFDHYLCFCCFAMTSGNVEGTSLMKRSLVVKNNSEFQQLHNVHCTMCHQYTTKECERQRCNRQEKGVFECSKCGQLEHKCCRQAYLSFHPELMGKCIFCKLEQ